MYTLGPVGCLTHSEAHGPLSERARRRSSSSLAPCSSTGRRRGMCGRAVGDIMKATDPAGRYISSRTAVQVRGRSQCEQLRLRQRLNSRECIAERLGDEFQVAVAGDELAARHLPIVDYSIFLVMCLYRLQSPLSLTGSGPRPQSPSPPLTKPLFLA